MDWDNPIESNIQLLFDMSGEDYYQQVTSLLQIVNDTKDKEWSEYLNGDYNKIPAKYRKMTFLQKLCILLSYGKSDSIYRIVFIYLYLYFFIIDSRILKRYTFFYFRVKFKPLTSTTLIISIYY